MFPLLVLGCAKGGLPESTAGTFGVSSAASTNAMTTADPTDGDTGSTGSDTGGTGPSSATMTTNATAEGDSSASAEVGGEDCGNGAIDGAEQCDGAELGDNDCVTAGFVGGTIGCTAARRRGGSASVSARTSAPVGASRCAASPRAYDNALVVGDPVDAERLLWLATTGGAQALGLGDVVGRLAPGFDADIIAVPRPRSRSRPRRSATARASRGCSRRLRPSAHRASRTSRATRGL